MYPDPQRSASLSDVATRGLLLASLFVLFAYGPLLAIYVVLVAVGLRIIGFTERVRDEEYAPASTDQQLTEQRERRANQHRQRG